MIQAGGYGQILGTGGGGGAGVGGTIWQNQRSEVTFSRWVQIERLNLERRRLRQQEAQAEANRDLAKRQFDLQSQKYNLEVRRLEMAEQQRQEQAARAEQIYNAQLERQQYNDAWQQDYRDRQLDLEERKQDFQEQRYMDRDAAALAKSQSQLASSTAKSNLDVIKAGGIPLDENGNRMEQNGYVPYTDATGRQYMVPVGKGGSAAGRMSDSDKLLYRSRSTELENMQREIYQDGKDLSKLELQISELEASAKNANFSGTREEREEMRAATVKKYEEAKQELEDKRTRLAASRAYLQRSVQDANLDNDIGWLKWKSLPWSGKDAYSVEQRDFVLDLLNSKDATDYAMLCSIAARGNEKFDLKSAQGYRQSSTAVKETIPAASWMSVDWEDSADAETKKKMQWLIENSKITSRDVNALADGVNALLGEENKAFHVPKQNYRKTEQAVQSGQGRNEPQRPAITSFEIDEGDNGRGLVVKEADGNERVLLPLEKWNALSEEAKVEITQELKKALKQGAGK